MICSWCKTRQKCAQDCRSCGKRLGQYFCDICNFWDDDGFEKEAFHCDLCGICRVGGRENYFHCTTCNSCYPIEIQGVHRCVENAMKTDCPVCLEGLFHSTREVRVLQCGHTIHAACLEGMMQSGGLIGLRCPICNSTLLDSTSSGTIWDDLDLQVSFHP